MANRRMFSLDVVDTDKFLDMPATSQNLYFHLGLRADDDGFVSSPKKITKLVNCGSDDLNVLISRGFVIVMDGGIVVVRHWRQNNYIQSDRYKATIYQEQKKKLVENNGVYELSTECIQTVSKVEAQVSIGEYKDNICSPDGEREGSNEEKESRNAASKTQLEQDKEDFEKIYAEYPKKRGKAKAFEYYRGYVGKGRAINGIRYRLDRKEIYLAMMAYIHEREQEGTEIQFYQDFSRFMNKTILDYLQKGG